MKEEQRSLIAQMIVKCARKGAEKATLLGCEPHKMCNGCAFKPGTEANEDPVVIDALKCLFEPGKRFMCHEKEGEQCSGYLNAQLNENDE